MSVFDTQAFNQNLFFPRKDYAQNNDSGEDIFLEVTNGIKIHIRKYSRAKPTFSFLYFHGNGEIVSDHDEIAENFLELGGDFIVSDYRGYGKSEGTPNLKTSFLDARAIYTYLKQDKKLQEKVIIMGRSLGSAHAIELASNFSDIYACIIESGYSDPIKLLARRGIFMDYVTQEENELYNNGLKFQKVTCPTLIMHGDLDTIISKNEAMENYKNLHNTKQKELVILDSVGHNDILLAKENMYFKTLQSFIEKIGL